MSKPFIAVGLLAVILLVIVSYLFGSNDKEILKAQLELERLKSSRDSIKALVTLKDSMQKILRIQIEMKDAEASLLRDKVTVLEEQRAKEQLSIRNLRRREDLQLKFAQTFPEVAGSQWGVREVYNEEADLSIEYLLVPLWFSETFIIDHQNSINYKAQRDTLIRVDSLMQEIFVLKDSVFVLQEEKTLAYKNGYDEAFAKYEDLNGKYINELKKPNFGWQQWGAILGGVGVGVLIGSGR